MWSYNGSTLLPESAELQAGKTVDGETPTAEQTFRFKLEELKDGAWSELETVTNQGGAIKFKAISFRKRRKQR